MPQRSPTPGLPASAYTGPPRYHHRPRWGFPPLVWFGQGMLVFGSLARYWQQHAVDHQAKRFGMLADRLVALLWVTAGLAAVATAAECWRYVLLAMSGTTALSVVTVGISDALVIIAGLLSALLSAISAVTALRWMLQARKLAARDLGQSPARSDAQVITGAFIPGWNVLSVGTALAELEHAALARNGERDPANRPQPTRMLLSWWVSWAASVALGLLSALWWFRDGAQALADGVFLHIWSNLSVAVLAYLSVRLMHDISALLLPAEPQKTRNLRVRSVGATSTSVRRARPSTSTR